MAVRYAAPPKAMAISVNALAVGSIFVAETKARLQRYGNKAKGIVFGLVGFAIPIFGGMTIGAAWSGHKRACRLERDVEILKGVVDNNATVQQHDRDKLLELEHQQNALLERALKITEGKAD